MLYFDSETPIQKRGDIQPENAENHKLGERTPYIMVFDHKERTTRVYTRDDEVEKLSTQRNQMRPSLMSDTLYLKWKLAPKPIAKAVSIDSDSIILDSLRKHVRSILEHIQYRLTRSCQRKQNIYYREQLDNESGGCHQYAPEVREGGC